MNHRDFSPVYLKLLDAISNLAGEGHKTFPGIDAELETPSFTTQHKWPGYVPEYLREIWDDLPAEARAATRLMVDYLEGV